MMMFVVPGHPAKQAGRGSARRRLGKENHWQISGKMGISMDWFKRKSTGNHGFYHQIFRGFRFQFSHHPILGVLVGLKFLEANRIDA